MTADGGDLLFSTPISDESIHDLHPSAVHIFRLWQTFLDNVNPIVKIFHAPTVQQQILDASADLEKMSKKMEALMFGIYSIAITSLTDAECKSSFGEEKARLLSRYQAGACQALLRASLLRTSDMMVLQAYMLYLVCQQHFSLSQLLSFCLESLILTS